MCGVVNCPLAFREVVALRKIVNELTDGCANNSMSMSLDAGRLLYDVSVAIGLDPWSVLNPAIMSRLEDEDMVRLWPTCAAPEEAEMAETDAIREEVLPAGYMTKLPVGAVGKRIVDGDKRLNTVG